MDIPIAKAISDSLSDAFVPLDRLFLLDQEAVGFRPDYEDAWSISEHLEHVSLVNHFLLLAIGKGCRTALKRAQMHRPPSEESDLTSLTPIAVPGAFEWPPPAHMIPSGLVEPNEVRALLRQQAIQCQALLDGMPNGEGRLYSIRMSVNNLGRLDMYQWLYFLAQHARYHVVLCKRRQEEFQATKGR